MSSDIGDIVRDNLHKMIVPSHCRKVLTHIKDCRTAKLGGHQLYCDDPNCNYTEISYNSCRDRNCPKCQGSKRLKWVSNRLEEVLPVNYFHLVFTVPSSLRKVFKFNKRLCLKLLFKATSETLNEVSLTNKKLKAKIGFIAVLHTWTQRLHYHPHIHCIVPGGGISISGDKWKSCSQHYLLPKKVLALVFRGKLLQFIENAYKKDLINYPETEENLKYLNNFYATLKKASRCNWVVYTKKAFGGPSGVINYLGNYTHRIAISNKRIVSYENGEVTFSWKDRRDGNKTKLEHVNAIDFIQRFMFHILPERFVKIRYYGFLASAQRKKYLRLCKELINKSDIKIQEIDIRVKQNIEDKLLELVTPNTCPYCKKGLLLDSLNSSDPNHMIIERIKAG
jgi:hypothetical protein